MDVLPITQSLDRVASDWNAEPPFNPQFEGFRERPVTPRQIAFVEDCVGAADTFDQVLRRNHLPPRTLAGWLTELPFRVHVHRAVRALVAQSQTQNPVDPQSPTPSRRAVLSLIRLARDSEAQLMHERTPETRPLDATFNEPPEVRKLQTETRRLLKLLEDSTVRA